LVKNEQTCEAFLLLHRWHHELAHLVGLPMLILFMVKAMFIERLVSYSALFTSLVGWHASAASLPQDDIIFAQLACPLNDVIFLIIE
jgi:hypothetical protein